MAKQATKKPSARRIVKVQAQYAAAAEPIEAEAVLPADVPVAQAVIIVAKDPEAAAELDAHLQGWLGKMGDKVVAFLGKK